MRTPALSVDRGAGANGTSSSAPPCRRIDARQQRTPAPADPVEVLHARAWARWWLIREYEIDDPLGFWEDFACDVAQQVHCGRLDLHEAVDTLQHLATRVLLVDEFGQDAIQSLMAEVFAGQCELRMAV
jgi:hypothetical protein